MRFDYYTATIDAPPQTVLDTLKQLGHEFQDATALARSYRYQQGFKILHDRRGAVATVCMGGNGSRTLAFASGENTDQFVDLVRSEWTDNHFVTRADAAQDFIEPKSYNKLQKVCKSIAKANRLQFPAVSDELNPTAGRTQYIGSPKSNFRARLYEKGFEQLARMKWHPSSIQFQTPDGLYVAPDDWVRLELQVRPQGDDAKFLASHSAPEQFWGFSHWTHELASKAMALELERITLRQHKHLANDEKLRWMCKMYGNALINLHQDVGDWAAVGLTIGEMLQEVKGH
jgi:hypothetical protein